MIQEKLTTKVLIMDSGERVVIVINTKTAIPHLHINRFLFYRRKPVLSFKSLKKEAEAICILCNQFPMILEGFETAELFINLSSKEIYKIWETLKISKKVGIVGGVTHMYRWDVFYRLVDYFSDVIILNTSHSDPNFKNLEIKKKIILREIKRLHYGAHSKRLYGLDKEIIVSMLEVTRESSIANPWIERDRLRNQIIVDILFKLGLRSGELLKIATQDITLGTNYPFLVIKKTINDINDPRKNEPRVKTFGRILELDSQLVDDLTRYLKQRKTVLNAKKSKYLFVSNTTGKPISYDRLQALLETIRIPNKQDVRITPHSLRRSWNDFFREYAEQSGVDQEIITQTQNYLQGRMLNSSEAGKYSIKYIEQVARKAHLDFQNSILTRK